MIWRGAPRTPAPASSSPTASAPPAVAMMSVPLEVVITEEAESELRRTPMMQPTHDTSGRGRGGHPLRDRRRTGERRRAHACSTWAQRVPAEHWFEAGPGDLVWCAAGPDGAEADWNLLFGPWACGAELVVHEGSFDAEQRLDLLAAARRDDPVPDVGGIPADRRCRSRRSAPIQLGRLRHAVSVGEQRDLEASVAFQDAFGVAVQDGFGQIENTILVANVRGTVDQHRVDRASDSRSRDGRDRRRRGRAAGRPRR